MDNTIKTFVNEEFGSVRTIEENGMVMFCGKDVALALQKRWGGDSPPHRFNGQKARC
ncbi:hypothetical protein [Ruminococcus sp.]|uniref:hypothetical protein n=1 Tax=Ruminococcus sp. TaxID=41978 RepID=UPI0039673938